MSNSRAVHLLKSNHIVITIFFLSFVITSPHIISSEIPKLEIMTEDWEPYQYLVDGKLTGFSVDLFAAMLEKVGSEQNINDIKLLPWARGYVNLENNKNAVLFLTTRTTEREKIFKWVGPVFKNQTYLIAKRESAVQIDQVSDLKGYNIGTVINDVGEQYLINLGLKIEILQRNTKSVGNLRKLIAGRLDLIIDNWSNFEADAKELNIDVDDFEVVYLVDSADVSYAFNASITDDIISEFQNAFIELKQLGFIDYLFQKYQP